ncbi:MAG TPA: pilin [Candidatus Saccharimonadales bacterium]|nr:pilin [Candidatus Saccharimonadales bacterium]
MFKTLRKNAATLITALSLALIPVAVPAVASAAETLNIGGCVGGGTGVDVGQNGQCAPSQTANGTTRVNDVIKTIVNVFSAIVGVVSVVMIIFGGFKYITSGGDTGNITSAKNTIIYAVIGLVVVALAQFIVQFVLNRVAGTT